MKNKSLGVALVALTLLSATVLFVGCKKEQAATDPAATETTQAPAPEFAEVPLDENGIPYISEEFGSEDIYYAPKGEATLTINQIPDSDNSECLISNRGTNNSGIYVPVDDFRCNTINVATSVKSMNANILLSLQYDIYGNTTYVTIAQCAPSAISYTRVGGEIQIPNNATNISVYIEAGDVKDITVDYIRVSVVGDYIDPATVPVEELMDGSGYPSLSELYSDYFRFGVAIPTTIVPNENEEFRNLVSHEFNSITLENEMKPENILDGETCLADPATYNESPALDFSSLTETLDWAQENGIGVRGHCLIWYSQTPSWLFYENYDVTGELASRELMMTRMENYIKGVFDWAQENYPGLFYSWDVVNEAIGDNGGLRDCYWLQTIGDDYVQLAFQYAREYADPSIELAYNDYNEYQPSKMEDILEMLAPVAEAGNIDVMGMQSHMTAGLSVDLYVEAMNTSADELGVSIMITELDIGAPNSANPLYDQGVYYQEFFEGLIAAVDAGTPIESVTVWGISDDTSWRSNTTPLLFSGNLAMKSAFEGVVCAITGDELTIPDDYVVVEADYSPIYEDYENGEFIGFTRYSSVIEVVSDNPYEGESCLCNSEGTATYDGYCIDVSRFAGTSIHYSFAIRCDTDTCYFTADIENEWPHIEEIDTSSGEWILVEGDYDVPANLTYLQLYFESIDMTEFYLDNLSIMVIEEGAEEAELTEETEETAETAETSEQGT